MSPREQGRSLALANIVRKMKKGELSSSKAEYKNLLENIKALDPKVYEELKAELLLDE
jgi:hypothetical protein